MKKTQTPQEMSSVEIGKQLIEEKERKDAVAAEAKQTRELTIAERLIESVTCDVVKVPMKDSRGDYHILCRNSPGKSKPNFKSPRRPMQSR